MKMRSNIRLYVNGINPAAKEALVGLSFKGFYFSGGEPHVEVQDPELLRGAKVLLDARVGNMNDLGMLLALTDAVKRCRPERVDLLLPYFPGARQDREEAGYALTAKVYANLINSQGYGAAFILDPHSPVSPALLDRCVILPHFPLVRQFVEGEIVGLICPDAGAERRTLELAKQLGCSNVVFARKKRDPRTGNLSGFSLDPLPMEGTYLLADDLCDGGGTFIGLAEKYQADPKGTGPLHLWITHGIFSKGLDALCKYFPRVGCSDSFPSVVSEQENLRITVPQLHILPILEDKDILARISEGRR